MTDANFTVCPFDENELKLMGNFIVLLRQGKNCHLLRNDIVLQFDSFRDQKKGEAIQRELLESAYEKLKRIQELLLFDGFTVFQYREGSARYQIFSLSEGIQTLEPVTADAFWSTAKEWQVFIRILLEKNWRSVLVHFIGPAHRCHQMKRLGKAGVF